MSATVSVRASGSGAEEQKELAKTGSEGTKDYKANRWELFLAGEIGCHFCSCLTFFSIGIVFTIVFMRKISSDGTDIFSFETPLVKSDILIQRDAAFKAAVGEREGCADDAHNEDREACESDDTCQWDPTAGGGGRGGGKPSRCKLKALCPSPPPKPREIPMLYNDGTAWVATIYEARNGGNLLDDDILEHIRKFEEALLTDVKGAKRTVNGQSTPSAWDEDWCLYTYPEHGSGDGRCAAPSSVVNIFSMTEEGRQHTKEEIDAGYTAAGPLKCMCTDIDALCSVCTQDGGVVGLNATTGSLDPVQWPDDVLTCLAAFAASAQVSAASDAQAENTSATSEVSDVCASSGSSALQGTDIQAYIPLLKTFCQSRPSCQWAPPLASLACSASSFYHPTHLNKLVTGAEKAAAMEKLCDDSQPGWTSLRKSYLPQSFSCTGDRKASYARTSFLVGGYGAEDEGEDFEQEYISGSGGWYASETMLEAETEGNSGDSLRIMLFSSMTITSQYLNILLVDALLSFCSLVLVWAYLWWGLESAFLASVAMFEIVFSLPVSMSIWTVIFGQKIYFYQMLTIYMILGIGADDAFILYDAWLQSKLAGDDVSTEWTSRFAWAYRRSFRAMMVTTATTCGSFLIGTASSLPQVQTFCVFAAMVVLVDWLFCETLFASAIVVHERYIKSDRNPGECFGPGCCCGLSKIISQVLCKKCAGPLPKKDDPPQPRAMERFCEGTLFNFLKEWKGVLIGVWSVVIFCMIVVIASSLRTAEKPTPIGKESLDAIRGFEILIQEFSIFGVPTTSFVFGFDAEEPIQWGDTEDDNMPKFSAGEAAKLATPEGQLELLDLCRAADVGVLDQTRCEDRSCLILGKPSAGSCLAEEEFFKKHGVYMPADILCETGRYCFMEEFARYWATFIAGASCRAPAATEATACATTSDCAWDATHDVCHTTVSPEEYPGLPAAEFIGHLASDEYAAYLTVRSDLLRASGREYERTFEAQGTGVRLTLAKDAIQFAWVSFNATYPAENTVQQANEWYDRWEAFRVKYAGGIGGFQTTELYQFMVTQNEMVKAAVMGIGLSLLMTFLVLLAVTSNWLVSFLGLVNISGITIVFVAFIPIVGWSLGENESIFLIAVVGLSVDYSVHLLHVYNHAKKETREERAKIALAEMGISVLNSSITTLLAAAILFFCGFYFFLQFGGFIFIVIGLSIVMSILFLMPLLMVFGPEGTTGELTCCRKRAKQ